MCYFESKSSRYLCHSSFRSSLRNRFARSQRGTAGSFRLDHFGTLFRSLDSIPDLPIGGAAPARSAAAFRNAFGHFLSVIR